MRGTWRHCSSGTASRSRLALVLSASWASQALPWVSTPVQGQSPSELPQLSAADVVNFRFPNDWAEAPISSAMTVAYASADSSAGLLDPTPIYPLKAVAVAAPSADAAGDASSVVQPSFVGSINSAAIIRSARRSNAVLNEFRSPASSAGSISRPSRSGIGPLWRPSCAKWNTSGIARRQPRWT